MADEREMYYINRTVDKPRSTRREVLANLGQKGALQRPAVPRNEFFNNNNIARILEKVQDNVDDLIIDQPFIHEVLELMKCVHKSRPNWDMQLSELNTATIRNVVKNIQCGDRISSYLEPESAEIQASFVAKPPDYLYDVKYMPKAPGAAKHVDKDFASLAGQGTLGEIGQVAPGSLPTTDTAIATSILQQDKDAPTTLYKTAKQTHNYREFFINIDSRDRDVFANPDANRYTMDLLVAAGKTAGFVSDIDQRQVKDVVEVRLVEAVMPNIFTNSLPNFQQPYLYIDIDEFPGEMYTSSVLGRRIFGRMKFELSSLPVPTISFVNMETDSCVRKWWYKDPRQEYQNNQTPLAKLDRMTINILDYDGSLFDFGEDSLDIINVTSVGNKTRIETPTPHNLATNDLVYLKNIFNPAPPIGDGQSNTDLNQAAGYLVDSVVSATEFDIDLDSGKSKAAFNHKIHMSTGIVKKGRCIDTIIGAGAAGFMAAITAAQYGQSVALIDSNKKLCEKIRVS